MEREESSWSVAVKKGDVSVSQAKGKADCVVTTDRPLFNAIVRGERNAMAAILRGEIGVEGDPELLVLFQRVFAGPAESIRAAGSRALQGGRRERRLVQILDGNTFVVSDANGDIEASLTDPTGLFSFDTRFLSKWIFTLDGERLNPLSVDDLQYFETRFFLVPGTGTVYVDAKLSVIRRRAVGDGFHEELTILNHDEKPVEITVRLEAASDFADSSKSRTRCRRGVVLDAGRQRLVATGLRTKDLRRGTSISASAPATFDETGLTLVAHIEPHGAWTTDLDVVTAVGAGGTYSTPKYNRERGEKARPNMERSLEKWLEDAPRLESDWEPLKTTYRRSLVDLAALRFSPPVMGGKSLPAAGLPWFMTMFGRDSIFTSLQSLPFTAELAATTLLALGDWQGSRLDDFRDEDPGRILHEMRYGEMTAFEERPHSPYYGAADATMLYVVLLDEYERWTGDRKLVRDLEQQARAALAWIDDYADLMGNGYVSYQRRNEDTGLENQCWKDSWDSISYRDGKFPASRGPRASCKAMRTTRRCVGPDSHGWCGRTRPMRTSSSTRLRTLSAGSTVTSGSKTANTLRWLSTARENRSMRSLRTTATCSGAASSTRRRRRLSPPI